jgi:hypothetical protein
MEMPPKELCRNDLAMHILRTCLKSPHLCVKNHKKNNAASKEIIKTPDEIKKSIFIIFSVNKECYNWKNDPILARDIICNLAHKINYLKETIALELAIPGAKQYNKLSKQLYNTNLTHHQIETLVQQGADINYSCTYCKSPLIHILNAATNTNDYEKIELTYACAEKMLQLGAHPNGPWPLYFSPLYHAIRLKKAIKSTSNKNDSMQFINLLLLHGASPLDGVNSAIQFSNKKLAFFFSLIHLMLSENNNCTCNENMLKAAWEECREKEI